MTSNQLANHLALSEERFYKTKEYLHVYAALIAAAEGQTMLTYPQVAEMMGIYETGHNMAKQTGQLLGEISKRELMCGRPLLSVLCVKVGKNTPGPGFFILASQPGLIDTNASPSERETFWKTERDRVYSTWMVTN